MRNILLLGASGNIAPHIIPALEDLYNLRLADIRPHPDGKPTIHVDMSNYEQVLEASRGMDAIMNWTVVREDPVNSFVVSVRGAWHVMKAAAELGIKKVLHTGPEIIIPGYFHDHDIGDVPQAPGTGYYMLTKHLAMEIVKIHARKYQINTICYQFNGLGPMPKKSVVKSDHPPFTIVYDDLVEACRLALEIESVPGYFQTFNLGSYLQQGKYSIEKARRLLNFEPRTNPELFFKRPVLSPEQTD